MTALAIRAAGAADAAAICLIYNQGIEDRIATLETELRTPDERRQWLAARSPRHPVFVAEDGDNMQINVFRPGGRMAPVMQAQETQSRLPQIGGPSEITGPALSPDGRRLYFSSQRGDAGNNTYIGVTYEVYGPFV